MKILPFFLLFVSLQASSQEIFLEDVADAIKVAKKRVIVSKSHHPLCILKAVQEAQKKGVRATVVFVSKAFTREQVKARDRIAWNLHKDGIPCLINRGCFGDTSNSQGDLSDGWHAFLDGIEIPREMRDLSKAIFYNMVIVDNQIFSWNEYNAPDREDTPIVRRVDPKEIEKWEILFAFVSRNPEHLFGMFPQDPDTSPTERHKRFVGAEDPPFLGKYADKIFHRNTCKTLGIGEKAPEFSGRRPDIRRVRDLWGIAPRLWLSFESKEQAELFRFKPCPDCKPLDENWVEKGKFVQLKNGSRYEFFSSVITSDGTLKVTLKDGGTKEFRLEDVVLHVEK